MKELFHLLIVQQTDQGGQYVGVDITAPGEAKRANLGQQVLGIAQAKLGLGKCETIHSPGIRPAAGKFRYRPTK